MNQKYKRPYGDGCRSALPLLAMWLQSTVVLASCAALVSAGFVKPPTDLKNVSSYAGTNVRYK